MGVNEIYRIKELMLYEQFGANADLVLKYVESVINTMGGEVPFNTFLNGEATLREFRKNLTMKIKRGDYGSDFGMVSKNLQYLKNISAILGTLRREHEKDPGKFEGLDGFLFGDENASDDPLDGLNEKVLYGDFCKDCRRPEHVTSRLNDVIEARKKINQIEEDRAEELEELKRKTSDPEEMEHLMKKLYGDSFGLLSFFTKGHITRGQDILDKYNLRDYNRVSMGKNSVSIEIVSNVDFKDDCKGIKWGVGKTIYAEYVPDDKMLVHRSEGVQCDVYISMRYQPEPNKVYNEKIIKISTYNQGSNIETEPKGMDIKFKVNDGSKKRKVGRPKNSESK